MQAGFIDKLMSEIFNNMKTLNQNQIDYKLTGKLIVATNDLEVDNLNKLIIKAKKSNIDIDILDANDLKKYDNRVSGLKAVFVKKTGRAIAVAWLFYFSLFVNWTSFF